MADNCERVDQVLAEYMLRRDAGEDVQPDEVINANPDIADELRSFFLMDALVDKAVVDVAMPSTANDSTFAPEGALAIPSPAGYELRGELGRGGMGIVYRAFRTSTRSEVALKVLPPALAADPLRMARFKQEAATASKLTVNHVLQIHDIIEVRGIPIIVMPLIEGANLGQIIRQRRENSRTPGEHPWVRMAEQEYVQKMLRVADQVTDAVSAIHRAGILHRDVKPSNVLIDQQGNSWLTDFGLSRFAEEQGLTTTGDLMGTRGYMSPEQASGKSDIDYRSDLFSLGVTIHEALTGILPYGKETISVSTELPQLPSRRQRLLSRDYDTVILKAIEPDRRNRYSSLSDFQSDWARVRQGLLPTARRVGLAQRSWRWLRGNRWLAVTVTLAIAVIVLAGALVPKQPTTYRVELETEPAGGRGVLVPIDPDTGVAVPDRKILSHTTSRLVSGRLTFDDVLPGDYWVEVEVPGHGFQEVFRRVPDLERDEMPGQLRPTNWVVLGSRTIRLHKIDIPSDEIVDGMARCPGSPHFEAGFLPPMPPAMGRHLRPVDPFYIDTRETTVGACRRFGVPHSLDDVDAEGPMRNVSFDEACEYAEKLGKRLPTEFEYEFVATSAGMTDFPWGDNRDLLTVESFGLAPISANDVTATKPPIKSLFSGVAEWTTSFPLPYPTMPADGIAFYRAANPEYRRERIVRGGSFGVANLTIAKNPEELQLGPRYRHSLFKSARYPGVGFRCARSDRPRFLPPVSEPRSKDSAVGNPQRSSTTASEQHGE